MRLLTLKRLKIVSGGNLSPGITSGAQVNGFQPKISAGDNGMGLFKYPISNSVAPPLW